MPAWCQPKADHSVSLTLYIQPGAKKTEVCGIHGEALKIRLAAPPVEGKANQALIRFLADQLGITKASITLVTGETNRNKRLILQGVSVSQIEAALLATSH